MPCNNNNSRNQFHGGAPLIGFRTRFDQELQQKWCCPICTDSCRYPIRPQPPPSPQVGKDCASRHMKTCGSTGPNVCYPLNQSCPSPPHY